MTAKDKDGGVSPAILIPITVVTHATPVNDLGAGTYLGFAGGLYPGGLNQMPSTHAATGAARARTVVPRDVAGAPAPGGRIVLLSVGMSITTQEWCSDSAWLPCNPWSFTEQAYADPAVNHSSLVIANGAKGRQPAQAWDQPTDTAYNRVRDQVLTPLGVTEAQVQVVWLKSALNSGTVSLPSSTADAYSLLTYLGGTARALRIRYPNLAIVYLSSRSYGGYALPNNSTPEPFAYETGFSVKWLVGAQITQMASGTVDPKAGDLNYNTVAPWVAWAPYLWANGATPRSDGLFWLRSDYGPDGTHPSQVGVTKIGGMLLQFFKTEPTAACWFLAGGQC